MKRIALIVCGLLVLALSNTAEARRSRGYNNNYSASNNYSSQPATQVTAYRPVTPAAAPTTAQAVGEGSQVSTASYTTSTATPVATSSPTAASTSAATFSTATAQGVANIMASRNQVGHWGGNRGYEGCGCGASPQAAYSICCYANSGMATVDVGYAQASNGMWYCCRRYR
jgi:hypothetical protein